MRQCSCFRPLIMINNTNQQKLYTFVLVRDYLGLTDMIHLQINFEGIFLAFHLYWTCLQWLTKYPKLERVFFQLDAVFAVSQ